MQDQTNFNFGDQQMNFNLLIEPETGLPSWVSTRDEFWIRMVGSILYDYCNSHRDALLGSDLTDRDNYAAEMSIDRFKDAIFVGEALRFKDIVMALKDILKPTDPSMPMRTYICLFSDSTEHYVSALIENGNVKLASQLGGIILS